jgi:hypothetical protein
VQLPEKNQTSVRLSGSTTSCGSFFHLDLNDAPDLRFSRRGKTVSDSAITNPRAVFDFLGNSSP